MVLSLSKIKNTVTLFDHALGKMCARTNTYHVDIPFLNGSLISYTLEERFMPSGSKIYTCEILDVYHTIPTSPYSLFLFYSIVLQHVLHMAPWNVANNQLWIFLTDLYQTETVDVLKQNDIFIQKILICKLFLLLGYTPEAPFSAPDLTGLISEPLSRMVNSISAITQNKERLIEIIDAWIISCNLNWTELIHCPTMKTSVDLFMRQK